MAGQVNSMNKTNPGDLGVEFLMSWGPQGTSINSLDLLFLVFRARRGSKTGRTLAPYHGTGSAPQVGKPGS